MRKPCTSTWIAGDFCVDLAGFDGYQLGFESVDRPRSRGTPSA
jgi:hypothetical protein